MANNKGSGTEASYYPNSQIAELSSYLGGLKHGSCKEWYENGKSKSVAIYEDGYILPDMYLEYDGNGSIK